MTDNIYDFIFKENILTPTECTWALDELQELKWSIHSWHSNSKNGRCDSIEGKSESELSVAYPEKDSDLYYILQKSIDQALDLYKEKFPYCGVLSNVAARINKYSENTKMKEHVDHIHGIFDGKRRGIPILSIVGVLNDNYNGGEFVFNKNYEVKFKAGDILIFPSIFLYKHKVNFVTNGTRFSFVSWGY